MSVVAATLATAVLSPTATSAATAAERSPLPVHSRAPGTASVGLVRVPPALAVVGIKAGGINSRISAAASATRMHIVFADDFGSGVLTRMMEYGYHGEQVLVGDWNGDGKDGVALRRGSKYFFRNTLSSGPSWKTLAFGRSTDQVLVGDWNGDGKDTLAVRRGNRFIFRNTLSGDNSKDIKFNWGLATDKVLVGDWNGNGRDSLALKRGAQYRFRNPLDGGPIQWTMNYGKTTDAALVGDWDGNGKDSIGLRRGTTVYLRNATTSGPTDITRTWGSSAERILIGDWNGDRKDTIGGARRYNERFRVWELVNAERAKIGRARVTYSEKCLRVKYAQSWANHLAATSTFEHQRLGRGLCAPDAMAENIAAGYSTASSVMTGWMNSAGHRANILSSARTSVTIGIAASDDAYGVYWVQDFT